MRMWICERQRNKCLSISSGVQYKISSFLKDEQNSSGLSRSFLDCPWLLFQSNIKKVMMLNPVKFSICFTQVCSTWWQKWIWQSYGEVTGTLRSTERDSKWGVHVPFMDTTALGILSGFKLSHEIWKTIMYIIIAYMRSRQGKSCYEMFSYSLLWDVQQEAERLCPVSELAQQQWPAVRGGKKARHSAK